MHEANAVVDLVRFELEKVQSPTKLFRSGFMGEVDELGERASDLGKGISLTAESREAMRTSTATWLTTVVWFGSLMSFVSCS